MNAGPDLWLPAFIYSEENTPDYVLAKSHTFKAQTRLWGYNAGPKPSRGRTQPGPYRIWAMPVIDKSSQETDLSPEQEQEAWNAQKRRITLLERLQAIGLLAPKGDVDKILDTVVNNLEVTNNLDFEPEVRVAAF